MTAPAVLRRNLAANRKDVLVGGVLAAAAALGMLAVVVVFSREHWAENDFWFDSDLNRILLTMTERDIPPLHTNVHPAFALFFNPVLRLMPVLSAFDLSAFNKVQVTMTLVAMAWVVALFSVLRLIGCRRLDAVLFTALAMSSAAALFFSTIPETFPVAALTMLVVLLLLAVERRRRLPVAVHVAVGAATMGVTVSNGVVVALAASQQGGGRRRALTIVAGAAAGTVVLSLLQNLLFPSSQFVLDPRPPKGGTFTEGGYILPKESGGPLSVANAGLISTVVAPKVDYRLKRGTTDSMMSFQRSTPGSGSGFGMIATVAWVALLGFGLYSLLFLEPAWKGFRVVAGLGLAAQLGIHLFYGQEIFPYSMHFLPFLVVVAALGSLTRLRPWVLGLAGVVLVFGLLNNLHQLDEAHQLLRSLDLASRTARGGG